MAALTLGDMVRQVQQDLDDRKERQWKVEEIRRWLNEGYRLVWREILQVDEHYAAVEATFSYTGSTRHLNLNTAVDAAGGTKIYKIHGIWDATNASGTHVGTLLRPIKYIDQADYADSGLDRQTSNESSQRAYFVFGDPISFGLAPVPASARTIRMLYTPHITAMSELDSAPTGVPEDNQDAIVAYACKMARARVKEDTQQDEMRYAQLSNMNKRSTEDRSRQRSRHVHVADPSDYSDYGGQYYGEFT